MGDPLVASCIALEHGTALLEGEEAPLALNVVFRDVDSGIREKVLFGLTIGGGAVHLQLQQGHRRAQAGVLGTFGAGKGAGVVDAEHVQEIRHGVSSHHHRAVVHAHDHLVWPKGFMELLHASSVVAHRLHLLPGDEG